MNDVNVVGDDGWGSLPLLSLDISGNWLFLATKFMIEKY